uniref:Protein kinase domain-containing protein n=1 Tax=Palpitomonas bilix TaxID=652834 RepID=A0A7S3GAZ8_9EUKA|mmetsp:Transcript_37070/g.96075  ORF Transcript_37070/g.96075 Transcript_37070/m.96075 type:complete len:511 (+) Transcript_37070:46-1578(+)
MGCAVGTQKLQGVPITLVHSCHTLQLHEHTDKVPVDEFSALEQVEEAPRSDDNEDFSLPPLRDAQGRLLCHPQRTFQSIFRMSRREVGSGSFGVVFLARRRQIGKKGKSENSKEVAVKLVEMEIPPVALNTKNPILLDTLMKVPEHLTREESNKLDMLHREIEIQASVHNDFILPVEAIFYNYEAGILAIAIVLQYANGGTLNEFLEKRTQDSIPLTLPESKTLVRGLLKGIAFLHDQKIVHRDLKPENILLHYPEKGSRTFTSELDVRTANESLSEKELSEFACAALPKPLIADFGLATQLRKLMRTFCGTIDYLSPEPIASRHFEGGIRDVLAVKEKETDLHQDTEASQAASGTMRNEEIDASCLRSYIQKKDRVPYSEQCDMWSFGVLAFETITGVHPFRSRRREATMRNILRANVKWPRWSDLSPSSPLARSRSASRVGQESHTSSAQDSRDDSSSAHDEDRCDDPRDTLPAVFVDFFNKLLVLDPEERLTAQQALDHPFLCLDED